MTENRYQKYILYVVGEILLVVIGILIALQIDNINEERKLQNRQSELLSDLKSDLIETLDGLASGRRIDSISLAGYRTVMKAIEDNEAYSPKIDSGIKYLVYFHVPRFTNTTYESIKSQGLDLITNDALKKKVTRLYEREFVFLKEDLTKSQWSLHNSTTRMYVNRYLRFKDTDDFVVYPVHFEEIKKDQGFINHLAELIVTRSYVMGQYADTINEISSIIRMLEDEIERLNS